MRTLLLALLVATLTACQASQPTTTNSTNTTIPTTQKLTLPQLDPNNTASLALPSLAPKTYRFTAGPRINQIATAKTQPYPHAPFAYKTITPDNRIEYGAFNEQGTPLLAMTEDLHHKAATFYNPPVPFIPANMQPGDSITFNTQLVILQLNAPWLVRETGPATVTFTHDGPAEFNNLPCQQFTTTWKIKLALASVAVTTTSYYHPTQGLVALNHDETITALFFPIKSKWAMQLEN